MRNRKYFPFERNNYYFGKLLTARDFEAEQRYMNDKRRLVNRLTGANGIVAGLGVIMADDASIILQAGCAFDASGREIVVAETKVIKLSTIEGFAQLTTRSAYLGISYDEQQAEEVYSVMSDEQGEARYNKTREQFKLTLLDESLAAKIASPVDDFIASTTIYADQDVRVVQRVPRCLPLGSDLKVQVEITRTAPGSGEYSFAYHLEFPGLRDSQNRQETEVSANGLKLAAGESRTLEYLLHPEEHVYGGGTSLAVTGFVIRKGDESFTLNQKLESPVKPAGRDLTGFYLSDYYGRSMDKTLSESYDERLWIAKITLLRQNTSVLIDSVSSVPFRQYSYNAQQLMTLRQLEHFLPESRPVGPGGALPAGTAGAAVLTEQPDQGRTTASGVFTMPLGLGYTAGESVFSEEIMHGLGKGPVYVDVGVEYITSDERSGSSEILLGDISVFSEDSHTVDGERLYDLSTAVKVLPERGTFIVGLRLDDPAGLISLRIRWFAMRLGEVSKQIKSGGGSGERMLMVNPDTIVLPPKATAHISPVFINMPGEACSFRLLDAEGGSVDQNGLYTAPSREGVFEIRVETVSDPTVYTHVFAIVTQKKKE